MESTTPASSAHHIESVENAAAKVLLMLKDRATLRVADVALELGIARSSAHRMLSTLQAHGMLRQEHATRAYRAGPQLVALGMAFIGAADSRSAARPLLEDSFACPAKRRT